MLRLLATGAHYNVTVLTQPSNPAQVCTVASGTGAANANVGNIVVTCSNATISIGGSVVGLDGTGLVLQDNGGDNLTVSANGTFTFANLIASGGSYNVTFLTQPTAPAQTCTVSGGTGTTASNVTTVQVLCPAVFFPVGGQVVGLAGSAGNATLQDNGGDNLPLTGNGPFTFLTQIAYGGQYDAFLLVQPPQTGGVPCVLWGYQGLVTATVTSILVDCGHNDWNWMDGSNASNTLGTPTPPPTPPITALDSGTPGGRKYAATWADGSGNLWLFGGIGWDTTQTNESIFMNDMWEFTGTQFYYGGFNTYWQQVQANNWTSMTAPLPRWAAITWVDNAGKLRLFAGQYGTLGAGGIALMNDMWSFDTTTTPPAWTQTATNPNCGNNANGTYGTKGTPSLNNCPGGRWGGATTVDASGNLWVFGGFGYDSVSSTPGLLNDLWEYTTGRSMGLGERLKYDQPERLLRYQGYGFRLQCTGRAPGRFFVDRFFRQFLAVWWIQSFRNRPAQWLQRSVGILRWTVDLGQRLQRRKSDCRLRRRGCRSGD